MMCTESPLSTGVASRTACANAHARRLHLGCGAGRDAIHLARHGFAVTGVDVSGSGLAQATLWANEEGLAIETVQEDLNAYRLQGMYDLVYASGTLTFLTPARRPDILRHYKEHTSPGDVNAFNAFVEKPYRPGPPDRGEDASFGRVSCWRPTGTGRSSSSRRSSSTARPAVPRIAMPLIARRPPLG